MRRYRTVILILLFGVVPVALVLVLGVTVILPALDRPEEEQEVAAPVDVVEEEPPPEPAAVRVALTAARALRPGALLAAGDVVVSEIGDEGLPLPEERYVYAREVEQLSEATPQEGLLRGYAVRRPLVLGEPVSRTAVVGPDDAQFLATVLAPDRVAVSIPVSLATRQARLVSPGNHVDVLLAVEQNSELLVRTIVENVRVLAVNSRVIAEDDVRIFSTGRLSGDDATPPEEDRPPARPEVATVTLEVLPVQAEHLALGAYEGQLSLAIRPVANAAERLAEPLQDMRSVLQLPEEREEVIAPPARPVTVRVVRGTTEETVVFADESGPEAGVSGDEPSPDAIDVGTALSDTSP